MNEVNKMLSAALKYQQMGFSVVPMGAMVVSKNEIKKFPRVKEWKPYQNTKASEEEIEKWWAKWPDALIGVICGRISGIIAIDTDTKEGDEELQSLLPENLVIPVCTTPRGGKHYIFKYKDGIETSNGTHSFEVKSDGAIIILPPSKIPDSKGYQWMS